MIDPTVAVLPVGIWLTLRVASHFGGGTDLDYRRREVHAAYTVSQQPSRAPSTSERVPVEV
ncbi:hypothetical protein [Nocardia sp. NBC_01327]|uniref:hypothetical protein n=1 Tax=Nocardia sp. NBC_01327 TaxID=2903593 RepID=UPI002E0EB21A|nr:hypothetical protein OG326_40905 [Nocardia sp. NBC_01327]